MRCADRSPGCEAQGLLLLCIQTLEHQFYAQEDNKNRSVEPAAPPRGISAERFGQSFSQKLSFSVCCLSLARAVLLSFTKCRMEEREERACPARRNNLRNGSAKLCPPPCRRDQKERYKKDTRQHDKHRTGSSIVLHTVPCERELAEETRAVLTESPPGSTRVGRRAILDISGFLCWGTTSLRRSFPFFFFSFFLVSGHKSCSLVQIVGPPVPGSAASHTPNAHTTPKAR